MSPENRKPDPERITAETLLQTHDRYSWVKMMAQMSRLPPQTQPNSDSSLTLPNGSRFTMDQEHFKFLDSQGKTFAVRNRPPGARIATPTGPPEQWTVPVTLNANLPPPTADIIRHPPQGTVQTLGFIAQAMTGGIEQGYMTIQGRMKPSVAEALRDWSVDQALGLELPHYEGPGVLRIGEAYQHLPAIAQRVTYLDQKLNWRAKGVSTLNVAQWGALLEVLADLLDLGWQLQEELLSHEMLCHHAGRLNEILKWQWQPYRSVYHLDVTVR